MKKIIVLLAFLVNCGTVEGEFGWAITEGDQDILEQKLYVVTDYKMMRENLIFSPNKLISLIYRFKTAPLNDTEFYLALYKKSLSYVEVDLKRVKFDPDSKALKTSFEELGVGNYLIKVANDEGELIDSVTFDVMPEDGYATNEEFDESIADEIIRYSKGNY